MSTLASTYWSDISGHFITCPTICHYNPDLLTVHDIFSDNKVLSYFILSSLAPVVVIWTIAHPCEYLNIHTSAGWVFELGQGG